MRVRSGAPHSYCTALIRGAPRDWFNENQGKRPVVNMLPAAHLSAPTLRAGTITCAPWRSNMVSTRDTLTFVLFFIAFAPAQSAPPPTRKSGMSDPADAASHGTVARPQVVPHRSRHVDRRFFKVRELEAMGVVRVKHIPRRRIATARTFSRRPSRARRSTATARRSCASDSARKRGGGLFLCESGSAVAEGGVSARRA